MLRIAQLVPSVVYRRSSDELTPRFNLTLLQ